jgi:hypothetical protein
MIACSESLRSLNFSVLCYSEQLSLADALKMVQIVLQLIT